jgi:hypothetical protein
MNPSPRVSGERVPSRASGEAGEGLFEYPPLQLPLTRLLASLVATLSP